MKSMNLLKRLPALLLAVTLLIYTPFSDYVGARDACATEVIIGGTATIAVEYAVAYLLGLLGFVGASALIYENADSLKAFGADCLDDFCNFCQESKEWVYLTKDKIGDWMDDVASGTLEKASDVWEAFKDWITQSYVTYYTGDNIFYMTSYCYSYNIDLSKYTSYLTPDCYVFSYQDGGSDYTRQRDCFCPNLVLDHYKIGAYVSGDNMLRFYSIDTRGAISSSRIYNFCFYNGSPVYGTPSSDTVVQPSAQFVDEFWDSIRTVSLYPIYETEEELYNYLKTGEIGNVCNRFTGASETDNPFEIIGEVPGIYDRDKSLDNVDIINPGALAGETAVDIDWEHIMNLVGTLDGIKDGTLNPSDVWDDVGVNVIDTTKIDDGTVETDFPWFGDIVGWLKKIYHSIMDIPETITDFFTIDTAVVSAAFGELSVAFESRFSGLSQISTVFDFSGRSFDDSPPVITMPTPPALQFEGVGDEIVVLDLRPYAVQLKWARLLLTAAVWVLFVQWLMNQFDVKFTIG